MKGNLELAGLASRGDAKAYAVRVRRHSDLVYRTASRMLGRERTQDASQEVWIRAWRKMNSFRGASAFSTWLYKFAGNTCLNERRKERRNRAAWGGEYGLCYAPLPSDYENDPESAALLEERREELLRALQHVRSEHRAVLVLRHVKGLGYKEVAEILGVPDGTAKGWSSRGRAALLVALSGKALCERVERVGSLVDPGEDRSPCCEQAPGRGGPRGPGQARASLGDLPAASSLPRAVGIFST